MPRYTVDFPDGQSITFAGPPNMSDVDAFDRALQERGVKDGTIQTTWFGGASKQASQEPSIVAPAIAAAGAGAAVLGAPAVAASTAATIAPLAARWIQYASQKYFGDRPNGGEPQPPSVGENAMLAAEGLAAGQGAKIVGKLGTELGALTRPHQLPNGQWVKGVKGDGVLPWAARTAGEVGERVGTAIEESVANPETVVKAARTGMGQMADAIKTALFGGAKESFTAAETARGIALLKAGVPQNVVLKMLLSQRVK